MKICEKSNSSNQKQVMNNKGQGAIELMLLSVVILVLAVLVLGMFLNFNDSTIAVSILKAETINELDSNYNQAFWIKSIDFEESMTGKEIVFDIIISPNTTPANETSITANLNSKVPKLILGKTKYTSVKINSVSSEGFK